LTSLETRFTEGFLAGEGLSDDDPEYDGAVPVQNADDRRVVFYDRAFAELLYDQLFPHKDSSGNHLARSYGLVVVSLYGALEAYAKSHAIPNAEYLWPRPSVSGRQNDKAEISTQVLLTP
jgi:hypothetical protein